LEQETFKLLANAVFFRPFLPGEVTPASGNTARQRNRNIKNSNGDEIGQTHASLSIASRRASKKNYSINQE